MRASERVQAAAGHAVLARAVADGDETFTARATAVHPRASLQTIPSAPTASTAAPTDLPPPRAPLAAAAGVSR